LGYIRVKERCILRLTRRSRGLL